MDVRRLLSHLSYHSLSLILSSYGSRTDADCGFRLAVTFLVFPLPGRRGQLARPLSLMRVLECFAGTGKRHSVCPPARGNTMIGLPRPTLVGLP
jgi:hypothetical protein